MVKYACYMNQIVRRAQKEDASKIIEAHRKSIREICSKDYSPKQIEVWSGRDFQEGQWHETIDHDFVWVVADAADEALGFGHLQIRNGGAKLMGLYFAPEAIGRGHGKIMITLMVQECKARAIKAISLTGTKTAHSFYEKVGFVQIGPLKEVPIGGIPFEVFEMRMDFDLY